MNVSGRNLLLFLLGGVLGIAMLLAVPLPDLGRHGVDPRTAVRILSPADRVEKLQQLGNAQLALSRLRDLMKEAPRQVLYRNASALLEAELEPAPITKPRPEDLRRLRADEQSFPDLLRYLEGIEHDGRIGQATEQFFSLEPHPDHVGDPDARARALLGKIRLGKNRLSPRPFLRLAETFRKLGRQRAQVRWLLRGYGRHPASDQLRSELVRVYLGRGQLEAAFAVTTQGTKWHRRDIAFWEQRAKIASWLSLPAAEARALEILLTMRDDRTARSRLVEIYPYLGEPELAVIHAVHLALGDGELSQQKSAVDFALTSGVTDLGIQLMEHIARRSEGPTEWLVKIAELSLQDLNFDRAISVYEGLARKHPDSEHEQRLEGLYRQRDMPEKLVDLLRRRLARHPEDSDLRSEVLNMLFGLGRRAEAIGIIRELAERPHSPRVFFQSLAQYEAIGIEGLAERGIGFALSPQMKPELLDLVFSALEPFIDRQEYREVAITLALRYPDHPASKRSRMLLIDVDHDDQKGAETAEELASLYPGDIEIHRVWLKRASWAGLIDSQIRARKRLLELDPEDDENRIELGELYLVEGRHEDAAEQFRFLAEIQGARSYVINRLAAALLAAGKVEEALEWLRKRASRPEATEKERLEAAEELFHRNKLDQALVYYRAVLARNGDQPLALLRLGQIHSWTNDPRGAIPYLEHRHRTSAADRPLVEYYLGEAYWAINDAGKARAYHEKALASMRNASDPSADDRSMVARMLSRLGREREALPIYRELLFADPNNVDLLLDFAETLAESGGMREARRTVTHVDRFASTNHRLLRVDGQVLTQEGKYREAIRSLASSLFLHGPEAGVHADLGRAQELVGAWPEAGSSFQRWFDLQDDSLGARSAKQRLENLLSHWAHAYSRYDWVADDSLLETGVHASLLTDAERTRIGLGIGHGTYSGRAQGAGNGLLDIAEDTALLDLSLSKRFEGFHQTAAGITAFPGASGNLPVSLWASSHLEWHEPHWVIESRLWLNELLTRPAAAPGMEGRSHGGDLTLFHDFESRYWGSASFAARSIGILTPGGIRETDVRVQGGLTMGYILVEGETATMDEYRVRHSPHQGAGPYLSTSPSKTQDLLINSWISYQTERLFKGAELASLIPVDRRSDYLLLSGSIDKHLRSGLGARVEAYLGGELHGGQEVWGASGALTWRPSPISELSLAGSFGKSLGRASFDDVSGSVRVQASLRW